MKLHRIELTNLNSLYGRHVVDLEQDLHGASLFLIVGPTGAGKSTLMDAVSLALFGQTPRLTPSSGKEDLDPRHVMSYGMGECLAVVEFSRLEASGARVRFRAEWACQRARKAPTGKLQLPQRSLSRILPDGTPQLEVSGQNKGEHDRAFARVLDNMTAKDFQRSVLLAQGEFAAFLKAEETDRAGILERLTDSQRYKQIGEATAKVASAYAARVKALEDQVKALPSISDEKAAEDASRLEALRRELERLEGELTDLEAKQAWLKRFLELKAAHDQAAQHLKDATSRLKAEDTSRLQEDRRCRVGEPLLLELDKRQTSLKEAENALPPLKKTLEEADRDLSRATDALSSADAAKRSATAAQEAMGPELSAAREAWKALEVAQAAHTSHLRQLEEAETRKSDREGLLAAASRSLIEATTCYEESHTRLKEQLRMEALIEPLSGLLTSLDELKKKELEAKKAGKALPPLRESLDSQSSALALATTALMEKRAALLPLTDARAKAESALEEALLGADSPAARREVLLSDMNGLKARLAALAQVSDLAQQAATASRQLEAACEEEQRLQSSVQALERDRETAAQAVEAAEASALDEEQHLQDLALAVKFAQERSSLREGQPCPLCGSTAHPYTQAEGSSSLEQAAAEAALKARHESVKAKVAQARARLKTARGEAEKVSRVLASQQGSLEARRQSLTTDRRRLADLKERLLSAREDAALPPSPDLLPQETERLLEKLRQSLESQLKTLEGARKDLEALEALREEARVALANAQREVDRREKDALSLQGGLESQKARLEAEEASVKQLLAAATEAESALVSRCLELGLAVEVAAGASLETVLREAEQEVASFKALKAEADSAQTRLREAVTREDLARQAYQDALNTAHARLLEVISSAKIVETRRQVAEQTLKGEKPEIVEQRLSAAIKLADEQWRTRQEAAKRAETRVGNALQALTAAESHHTTLERQESESAAQLDACLKTLELPDREALRSRLLPSAERIPLERRIDALAREETQAAALEAKAEEQLQAHLPSRPDLLTPETASLEPASLEPASLEPASLEALEASLGQVKQARDVGLTERGQLEQAQETYHTHKATLMGLRKRLEDARREHGTWKALHGLIGVREGDAFKRFAQTLNLQGLLTRANRRLKELAPRYALLAKDKEKLTFQVSDSHHAGHERPLSTLSGGEVFLVSLSLALALADYRQAKMPIETLLLDEGFGTLDTETLNTAMDALSRLIERQMQVGIISHVEGLRERIEAQINVEKLGNGRSTLRVGTFRT